MHHGQILLARRRVLRMTQDHLAGAALVSRSTVQRAERGLSISDENLRSLLAVLALSVEDLALPSAVIPVDPPVAVSTSTEASERVAALEMILLCIVIVAFATVRSHPEWFEREAYDAAQATMRFRMLLGYLALGLAGCVLAGRIVWRRLRFPDADGIVFVTHLPLGRIRLALPRLRWSRKGRPVATWPGGVAGAALALGLTFAAHYPVFGSGFNPFRTPTGFDAAYGASGVWFVEPGSRLERAGLRLGDRILAADGDPVHIWLDLAAAVADAEGRSLALTVARPKPRGAGGNPPPAEILAITAEVGRVPGGCSQGLPCGWIGDVAGLFSPVKSPTTLEAQIDTFLREVRTVSAMIVDPALSAHSEIRAGHPRAFRLWLDWLNFRMAAGLGILVTLLGLGAALFLQHLLAGAGCAWAALTSSTAWRTFPGARSLLSPGSS